MDDFLIFGTNKKELRFIKNVIEKFLKNKLDLIFNPKKANVFPIKTGIYFLGFRLFSDYSVLRKSMLKRFYKKMKRKNGDEVAAGKSFDSFAAFASQGRCWQTLQNLETRFLPRRFQSRLIEKINAELQAISAKSKFCYH